MNFAHLDVCPIADGNIEKIFIDSDLCQVTFKAWNQKIYLIEFLDCYSALFYRAIGSDISMVKINVESDVLESVRINLMKDDSTVIEEFIDIKQYSFISAWGSNSLLDIFAKSFKVTFLKAN